MGELPIPSFPGVRGYAAGGVDDVRWQVLLPQGPDDVTLVVDLPEAQRATTGLTVRQLDERLPGALRPAMRFRADAAGNLDNLIPCLREAPCAR